VRAGRADDLRKRIDLRLAQPRTELPALTLLTQLALGTVGATVALQALAGAGPATPGAGRSAGLAGGAVAAFVAGVVALGASLLHLGRPSDGWKALRNVRRSWLSREVALFSAFAVASMAYAGAWLAAGGSSGAAPPLVVGVVATVVGAAGIYASGRLYLVPARPVWNSPRTLFSFFATGVGTGPLLALLAVDRAALAPSSGRLLLDVAAGGMLLQLGCVQHLVAGIALRREREYRSTAQLLLGRFRPLFAFRVAAAMAAMALCWSAAGSPLGGWGAFARILVALGLCAAGELANRYLFFVTVTPMTAARSFNQRPAH
jgi:DMSO reductase anchor subunit